MANGVYCAHKWNTELTPFLKRIQEISTVSSVGMRKSEVRPYEDDPRDYYVDITWTPREVGEVIFCFTARDVNRYVVY